MPKAKTYAERWVSTIRRECLDRMLIFNERQLVRVLTEYEAHYNVHRRHRTLEQRSPTESGAELRLLTTDVTGVRKSSAA